MFENGRGYNPSSTHLWRDEFKVIELTVNIRQCGHTDYSDVLNRVRTGNQTESDVTLCNRLTSGVTDPVDVTQPPFVDALHLMPLKKNITRVT